MARNRTFRNYLKALTGSELSKGELLKRHPGVFKSDSSIDRTLAGTRDPLPTEVAGLARAYGKSPLFGFVEMQWLTPDEANRTALTSYTDIELCREILRRAIDRESVLDRPLMGDAATDERPYQRPEHPTPGDETHGLGEAGA